MFKNGTNRSTNTNASIEGSNLGINVNIKNENIAAIILYIIPHLIFVGAVIGSTNIKNIKNRFVLINNVLIVMGFFVIKLYMIEIVMLVRK